MKVSRTFGFALVSCLGFAPMVTANTVKENDKTATTVVEPVGYVLIEEVVLTDLRETPLAMLENARLSYRSKNYGAASAELKYAANMLTTEAKRAQGDDKARLESSAAALMALSKAVMEQKNVTDAQFENELIRAADAKANHHHFLASKEWAAKEYKRAGHDLRAAADAIERGAKWSGGEIAKGTHEVVNGARFVSGKLISGTGWVTAEVGKAIDAVGTEVQKLGDKITPEKRAH